MNKEQAKIAMEFYKDGFLTTVTLLFSIFILGLISTNMQAINTLLAKYNNLLDENRIFIMWAGICLILAAFLTRRVLDRKELEKLEKKI